ncbi:Glycine/D-amino acid oxidase [Halpernia humi]|uniref:Glycine/D-amino acid oxidase n=1 Tax=Halpernia humi TaxID=493375 RepID=A0A1H5STQ7_9FLAO|nr:FAD-dependent oxidoreductase [Halpernia humi]SEF53992.1 Glycine/D-amino acid oxidase [Halpernia humi]
MNSFWELETFYRKRDFIIIGAGFSGLWTAISLKEKFPEKSILVIERNSVPIGASTRNAGFACFGSLTEILSDADKMGWQKTLDLVKMRFEGLQKIQKYFKPEDIDFERVGGYEILNNAEPLERLVEVNEKLKSITGLEKTFFLCQEKTVEFGLKNTTFLVENPCEGSLHPGKLVHKLLHKCQNLGIEFLFGTSVLEIFENEKEVKINTKNFQIKAEKLVIATNAFAKDLIKNLDLTPVRGQILLTKPIKDLKLKGTYHYDEGYIYFRNVGNIVLLGGARNLDFKTEETTEFEITEFLQNYLEKFLAEVILHKQSFEISSRWTGIMAVGKEKSPIVKQISNRQFCAVRLSGMGVALAPKLGEQIAEMI